MRNMKSKQRGFLTTAWGLWMLGVGVVGTLGVQSFQGQHGAENGAEPAAVEQSAVQRTG